MSNEVHESEVTARLTAIELQLKQFNQLLSNLSDRIAKSEDNFLLIADIHKYKKLQELLIVGDLREADWETIRVIQAITKEPELGDITPDDMRQFPCDELRVIDNLWTKYSEGRFGFSVQIKIYQSVGGSLESTINQDSKAIERFGERVGWREDNRWKKCDDLDYTLAAPIGCHPSRWWNSPFGSKMTNYFFNRLLVCSI
ncbi:MULTISPECIES: GUN4 domain-containing protein [Nostocales]|uniref:GUN4 domain-containing protein n=3 Tax=Nostocales TaxID=1161 RepID=A0A0C1N627_9CYAN|nr:GUN4 domain-containing protein [Tolypothrix bouteillei]KAF3886015.1 GUN4 domain-containing protein [Tolypothrix bouteillei VB521301]